ncbi:MAG: GNAT family N-acetyltransferase [Exiguobacterium sp.]|uniref:GNAT family N-acetyltransferase n=1 Tax=Exiguobacterium sp. AB2 TaxID=1484479 RepID=UPI0004A94F17|nr:GNAT family N-acetyltransferase [Exiguobacterium sp. AB2]KDN58275.1 GNAT family acetyltransferase [Exiguobacterium sp. AB2]MDX5324277.1 GNAT family N-acetyltransferase [Exiguobacterium sp.]MDX5426112.1 GNAT family N-acetyltransferase [Exiguobacterium sp.]MDX6773493.1 GNAT family N-acetyltransferase [Exiguobacterium sp.]
MDIVRQPIRQIDEIEYEHFQKYGQSSYGISAEELKGIFEEMGTEHVYSADEHSYGEDFYFDLHVDGNIVGKVLLLKLARVYQLDLMVFDPYKDNGYATEGLRLALEQSELKEGYTVRAGIPPTSPHQEAMCRVLEKNGFEKRNGLYYLNFKKRYVVNH